ncbi:MAG: Fe-S cluster assembly protein SufD [Acidobacteria bacterium]|nr:MAG: Fe-S cluster assembly protein SufD [Acidobacteriota bacterium]
MAIALKESEELYLKDFRELEERQSSTAPVWLKNLRSECMQAFAEMGFPTTRLEDWKYCNVAPIAGIRFQRPTCELSDGIRKKVNEASHAGTDCARLVFLNGHYLEELSSVRNLPKGATVTSLRNALKHEDAVAAHMSRYAAFNTHPFVALNTAFVQDGAFIEVPKGVALKQPVEILYFSMGGEAPWVAHPRNLVIAAQGSQLVLVETYVGLDNGVYFNNAVTEIVAEDNAHVDYTKLQKESEEAFHVATVAAYAARSAAVATNSIQFGARLGREELTAVLDGNGAEAYLYGLYVTDGQQLIDNHTTIDHAQPHCSSREFYKGILDGKSTAVFNGKIMVRKDAQKTDSKQSDKNLLLSESASINTKPQLEIFADDVKCTHGATIGQIDPESIFYLRSRGIGLEEARSLLVEAFAAEIIGHVKVEPLRERLKAALLAKLKG